jgi:hypothetical protein
MVIAAHRNNNKVMVVSVLPPMITVGRGLDPPPSPSPAVVSEDAPFRYPFAAAAMMVGIIPPMMAVGRE